MAEITERGREMAREWTERSWPMNRVTWQASLSQLIAQAREKGARYYAESRGAAFRNGLKQGSRKALDEAAAICDAVYHDPENGGHWGPGAQECAERLRALKEKA